MNPDGAEFEYGYGYRVSAYSTLAELKSLLEQKTAALSAELSADYAAEQRKVELRLQQDLQVRVSLLVITIVCCCC